MNITSSSAAVNTIIQKIPIGRTEITINSSTMTPQQFSSTELLSTSSDTTQLALPMNSSLTAEHLDTATMKVITSSDKSSLTTLELTVEANDATTTAQASPIIENLMDLDPTCPDLENIPNLDTLTQDEFFSKLTDNCRYDRLVKPPTTDPLEVSFQIDLTHVESSEHLVSYRISKFGDKEVRKYWTISEINKIIIKYVRIQNIII